MSSGGADEPAVGMRELEIRLRRVEQEATKTEPDGIPEAQEWETGVQESIVQRLTHLETLTNDADDGFELGGQTYNCLEDCHDWLLLKGPGSDYLGNWIDPFSSSSYADTQGISANQTLVNKSTLKKAALECDQVSAVILLSFADDHPSMVGSSHLITDTSVLLPKVKMFSDWYLEGAIGKSVYSCWKLGADRLSKKLHQTLNRTWRKPIKADLRSVAQEFSVRTSAFIDDLNTFVKEFRSEATEAWSLLSAMLSAMIFKTMSDARDAAGDKPEDMTDVTLRAARVLWVTWQCHRVMAQFIKVGFRKHPCVLPALTLHLFSCKAPTAKVDTLTLRLASMEKTVAALGGGGPNGARGVSQKVFDTFVRKDHEPLAKRLKSLEDRS